MNTNIENAIKVLAEKVCKDTKPDEALKYTQAVLNLAHTKSTLLGAKLQENNAD